MCRRGSFFIITICMLSVFCVGCGQVDNERDNSIGNNNIQIVKTEEKTGVQTTPLSPDELAYFNEQLFNQKVDTISYNQFLTSIYNAPEKIDLFALFCAGTHLSEEVGADARVDVLNAEPSIYDSGYPLLKTEVSDIDAVLMRYLGMPITETEGVGLEHFIYLSEHSAYYHFYDDTYIYETPQVSFLSGDRVGDLIFLYYDASDMNLDIDDSDTLACVTLQKVGRKYHFISNQYVPIPNYLDRTPDFRISLKDHTPYTAAILDLEWHTDDCSFCIAKEYLDVGTICTYISTDGNTYMALLYNENEWDAGVFKTLPDQAYSMGFGFDGHADIIGKPAVEISYQVDGKHIREYYYLSEKGKPAFLAKCDGRSAVMDLDQDGDNELIAFDHNLPYLYFQTENMPYRVDVNELIKGYVDAGDLRYGLPNAQQRRLPIYRDTLSENSPKEIGFIYFYRDELLIYMETNT